MAGFPGIARHSVTAGDRDLNIDGVSVLGFQLADDGLDLASRQ
jgi:hypothetical protein